MTARSRSPVDVRIGIVGCGRATASLHLPALRRVGGAAITALCDADADRRSRLLSQCHGATGYSDYRDLLSDERVDLVAVCVPVTLHAEVASAALSIGKHVFLEKPLAFTLDECDRLVVQARDAESSGVRSVVGFNLRSHRLLRQAKAIIASGELGEIELLRTLWTADWNGAIRPAWHAQRGQGGGTLLEIGAHQADLWRWLLDSEVESVYATARSSAFDDQTATVQARMTSGVLVSGAVSQRTVSHNTVEVFGAEGSLRLSCYHADSLELARIGGSTSGLRRRLGPLLDKAAKLPAALRSARGGGDFTLSYLNEWVRIVTALGTGESMPASFHDGRQAAAITLAALRSSEEGAPVCPDPVPARRLADASVVG